MKQETINTSMFWNLNQTLTYNYLINVIVGNRGGGKSFGAKKWVIDNFIKKKEQFGYVRRYKDDLKEPMEEFFKDIMYLYPDYEWQVKGRKFYFRLKPANDKEKWTEDDIIGYGFVLSTAGNKKSIPYPNISTLIFDEFLIETGLQHYLKDEPKKFLNLYETIARPGTGHIRVRAFLLANAISVTNPYFLYWDLKMPTRKDKNGKYIWLHKTRPILVEDVRNEYFIDKKKNTEFGTLVNNTDYGEHSINNKFILDDEGFIEKKSNNAKYYFTMLYKDHTFGVWVDFKEGKMWVSKSIDPSCLFNYALTIKDHKPNTLLISTRTKRGHFKVFIDAYKNGCVYFETMNIKNLTYEIIKMVLNK